MLYPVDGYDISFCSLLGTLEDIKCEREEAFNPPTPPASSGADSSTPAKVPVSNDDNGVDVKATVFGATIKPLDSYCIDHGIMDGFGNGIFKPNGAVTRQQVWLTQARISGETPANAEEAREWAMEIGVPDAKAVTRQQFVSMLYRYVVSKGYDESMGEGANIFSYNDAFDVAEYAIPAAQLGCGSGVMDGYTDGTLKPTATTRTHLAAFLQRFCVNVVR